MTTLSSISSISTALRGPRRGATSLNRSSSSFYQNKHKLRAGVVVRAAGDVGGFVRYGVREEVGGDKFMETYGLNLGGSIGRETLTFAPNTQAVALVVTRPLGIVFEESEGKVVAVELVEGSNAEQAGVKVGDVLRMTSAVAVGRGAETRFVIVSHSSSPYSSQPFSTLDVKNIIMLSPVVHSSSFTVVHSSLL
jgi:hypothetical protein